MAKLTHCESSACIVAEAACVADTIAGQLAVGLTVSDERWARLVDLYDEAQPPPVTPHLALDGLIRCAFGDQAAWGD